MRKQFTTSLDEYAIKELKVQAIKEGCKPCDILEKVLIKYLAEVKHENKMA